MGVAVRPAGSGAATPLRPRPRPTELLVVLSLGSVAYAVMQTALVPALPEMQLFLRTTEIGGSWLLAVFLLSSAVATPIVGRVGDLYGRRRVLLLALGLFMVGSAICVTASSLSTMIAGRALQGAGGGVIPLAFGVIRDCFPRARASAAIAYIASLVGVGAALGLLISGLIIGHVSFTWLFWAPLVLAGLSAAGVWWMVPESAPEPAGKPNWIGAVLMTVGWVLVLLGVTQAGKWGWTSFGVWGLIVSGAIALMSWIRSDQRAELPFVDIPMIRERALWTANVCAFFLGLGTYVCFVQVPTLARAPESTGYGLGASTAEAGFYLVPWAATMLVSGQLAGRWAGRYNARTLILAGCGFAASGFAVTSVALGHPIALLASTAWIGAGIGLALAGLANQVLTSVSELDSGVATGVNVMARLIGGAFGAQAAAVVLDTSSIMPGVPSREGIIVVLAMSSTALGIAFVVTLLAPPSRLSPKGDQATLSSTSLRTRRRLPGRHRR